MGDGRPTDRIADTLVQNSRAPRHLIMVFFSVTCLLIRGVLVADEVDECGVARPESPAVVSNREQATETASKSADVTRELHPDALQFIRGIVLLLLPEKFDDDDGWGDETRIQSGVNLRFEDGQLRTSRRWKHVNHGSWLQASGELVEPETTFQLAAVRLPDPDEDTQRYEIRVSTRLSVTARQQQWSYGLMLWSVSADAAADVSVRVVLDVKSEIVKTEKGTRLRFLPTVMDAAANLDSFDLRRVSHARGDVVQEFGTAFEKLAKAAVNRQNRDLAEKINKSLQKKPERLEIPFDLGSWFDRTIEPTADP